MRIVGQSAADGWMCGERFLFGFKLQANGCRKSSPMYSACKYSARSRRLPTPARNSVLLKPFLYLRTSSETLQKPPFKAFFAARHGQNRANNPSLPENSWYGVKCLCRSSIAAHPRNKPNRNPCNSRCRTAKSSTWNRLMKPLQVWLRCRGFAASASPFPTRAAILITCTVRQIYGLPAPPANRLPFRL